MNLLTPAWETIVSEVFEEWFAELAETAQGAVLDRINVLRMVGPALGRPYADAVYGSRHRNMKELIVPHDVIRVFFAFDPARNAVLLCGASKKGDKRFYKRMIVTADRLLDDYLREAE